MRWLMNFVVGMAVACTGEVVDVRREATTTGDDRAVRCTMGGGRWQELNCSGGEHHCGLYACDAAFGPGCACPEEACWDGEQCRPQGQHACEATGGTWDASLWCQGQAAWCERTVDCAYNSTIDDAPGCRCPAGTCFLPARGCVGEND